MQTKIHAIEIAIPENQVLEFPEDMLLAYNGVIFPVLRQVQNNVLINIEEYGNLWIYSNNYKVIEPIDLGLEPFEELDLDTFKKVFTNE